MHPLVALALTSSFIALLVTLAIVDLRSRRIPNLLVAALFVIGLFRAAMTGEMINASLGTLLGAGLLLWQYRKGLMGAGDVKLLAALGSWLGPLGTFQVFLIGSVLGGVLSVIALIRLQQSERALVANTLGTMARTGNLMVAPPSEISRARGIPYGVALSIAAAIVFLGGLA
jgi:prepilin peptidase CpaA